MAIYFAQGWQCIACWLNGSCDGYIYAGVNTKRYNVIYFNLWRNVMLLI